MKFSIYLDADYRWIKVSEKLALNDPEITDLRFVIVANHMREFEETSEGEYWIRLVATSPNLLDPQLCEDALTIVGAQSSTDEDKVAALAALGHCPTLWEMESQIAEAESFDWEGKAAEIFADWQSQGITEECRVAILAGRSLRSEV